MPLEGIFIEPSSTASTPDLSLHISPPSTTSSSSSLICNITNQVASGDTNYGAFHNSATTTNFHSQAHTELSLGRNFCGGGAPPEEQPPHNPYYHHQSHAHHFHHLHHHSNTSTTTTTTSTTTTTGTTSATSSTHLNHINYGVSLLDVSSEGLRPIKGIPVYHNRSFPFLPMEHPRDKDQHHHHQQHHHHPKMCLYHHMPSYPSLSSSCSSLCSTTTPSHNSPSSPYFPVGLDPMSFLNSGGTNGSPGAYRAATATRFNGIPSEAFKSHPLHHSHYGVGIGPSEASSGLMRSRFLPKLPTKRSMRAPRMRWTSTLHARFVHAVELLGGHESKDIIIFYFFPIIFHSPYSFFHNLQSLYFFLNE